MPLIKLTTAQSLDKEQKEQLKTKLGQAITILPGKSESVLMIDIMDCHSIYFRGEENPNAAYVTVDLYGTIDRAPKAEFTEKVFLILEETIGVPKTDAFVRVGEYPVWGAGGKLK